MRKNTFAKIDGGAVFQAPLFIYCDYAAGRFFAVDGERKFRGESFEVLFRELGRIREARLQHFRNHEPQILVIVNDLNVFSVLVKDFLGDAQSVGSKSSFGSVHTLELRTAGFLFRNFNFIANARPEQLCSFFEVNNPAQAMVMFFDKLAGDRKHYRLRWSLANITKKDFYHDIRGDLWKEMKKEQIFFHSFQHYQDMFSGNKSGALMRFDDPARGFRKIIHDVSSFDKKSAYPSVFVNDDIFPLSRPIRVMKDKTAAIRNAIQSRHWFKIVIRTKEKIPELVPFRDPDDSDLYGVEYYDLMLLKNVLEVNPQQLSEILNRSEWRLYTVKHTGRLCDVFREAVIKAFILKNAILDKNNFERFTRKTQLDMMFGKAIQKKNFVNVKQVNKYYTGRGENYLLPQHSMHAIARVRYEVMRAVKLIGPAAIAFDTDAIKVQGSTDIFKVLNDEIMMANAAAGYPDSEIGLWLHEWTAQRFLLICTKSYMYDDGEIHTKHAGISDSDFQRYADKVHGDLMQHFTEPRILKSKGKYLYSSKDKKFIRTVNDFTL